MTDNTHNDALIDQFSSARFQQEGNLIVPKLPICLVDRPTDKYSILSGSYLRDDDDTLDTMGRANRVQYDYETPGTYSVGSYGFVHDIPGKRLRNMDPAIQRKEKLRVSMINTGKLVTNRDRRGALQIMNSTAMSGYTAAVAADDQINNETSSPFKMFSDYMVTIRRQCGYEVNTYFWADDVWQAFCQHPDVMYRTDPLRPKSADMQRVNELFENFKMGGIQHIIGKASYNTAKQGLTPVYDDIWKDGITLAYVDYSSITEDTDSFVKVFVERGRAGVRNYYFKESNNQDQDSLTCRTEVDYQVKLTNAACGYYLSDCLL